MMLRCPPIQWLLKRYDDAEATGSRSSHTAMRASICPVPRSDAEPTPYLQQLSLIQSELTEISLSLSIVCSIANAGVAKRLCQYTLLEMFKFAPTSDGLVKCLELCGQRNQIDSTITNAVSRLITLIGLARNVTAVATKSGAPELIGAVVESWTRAASACVVAGIVIDRELPENFVDELTSPAGIRRLLREACGGDSPCIDHTGALYIPGWAERRVGTRCETRRQVIITSSSAEGDGTVTNVSAAGMKIDTDLPLTIGEEIMIANDEGVRVKGYVIWTNEGEAGIEADTLIDPVDFVRV